MHRLRLIGIALGLLAAVHWPTSAEDRVTFIQLGREVLPYTVGANAFMVAGAYYGTVGPALVWTPASGDQRIGGSAATAISRDGKTIAGDMVDDRRLENAAIWRADRPQWEALPPIRPNAQPCDALLTSAFDMSADGKVVVGLGWDGCGYARAFRWEASTGTVDLGSANGRSTRANGVSDDGRVVVGWTTDVTGVRIGAKWVNNREELIPPRSVFIGEARATNHDGSIIVGDNCDPVLITNSPAWMWTAARGVECMPVQHPNWLPRNLPYRPFMDSLSDDGRVIGGFYSCGLVSDALLWIDGRW
jgi:probable HAF family extracellular repeat protein